MRCDQVEPRLSALIDEELGPVETGAVRRHLETCAECAGRVVALRDLRTRLRAWDEAENRVRASRTFRRRVLEAARAEARPAPARPRRLPGGGRPPILLVASSLAAAALLVVAGLLLRPASPAAVPTVADARAAPTAGDLVAEAGELAAGGRVEEARGRLLRALAIEPGNPEALAILGHAGGFPAGEHDLALDREAFRQRVRELPLDRVEPLVAKQAGDADLVAPEERVAFEGHEIARGAIGDYIEIRERERLLAAAAAERGRSVAEETPAPEPAGRHVLATYAARLEPVRPEAPNRFETLTLLPVLDREGGVEGLSVVTADAAIRARKLRLVETGEQLVRAVNRMGVDVFLPAGTILTGLSQDRVVTRDVIVSAGRETTVPVLCCEEGQPVRPGTFGVRTGVAGPGLRRLVLRERDQGLVWARVANQTARLGAASRTGALRAAYEKADVLTVLARARERLVPLLGDERVVGFVVADGDRILGADVFGSHALFSALSERFLDSYLIDAMTDRATGESDLTPERAKAFLTAIVEGRVHESRGAGAGRDAQLTGEGFFGYGLTDDGGRPVHLSVFPLRSDAAPVPPRAPDDDAPRSGVEPPEPPGADGPDRTDPSEAGRRAEERRDRIRRGAPAAPRPIEPPSRATPPGGRQVTPPAPRRPEDPRGTGR